MGIYLGRISINYDNNNRHYVDFKPSFTYLNDDFLYLNRYERKNLLPESYTEKINFYSSDTSYDVLEHFQEGQFCLLEFDPSHLEDNISQYSGARILTGYKLDVSQLLPNQLRTMDEIGLYYLVDPSALPPNYCSCPVVPIADPELSQGMQVVLPAPNKPSLLLGPFPVSRHQRDNHFTIRLFDPKGNYLIPAWQFHSQSDPSFKRLGRYENDPVFVRLDTPSSCPTCLDVLPQELLLKSFRDSLDSQFIQNGKVDLSDPEPLVANCRSSLLVGQDIPPEIQEKRLEQLTLLLTKSKSLNDTFTLVGGSIAQLFLQCQDTSGISQLIDRLSQDPQFMGNIQQFEIINERITAKQEELQELSLQLEHLRQQTKEENLQAAQKLAAQYDSQIQAQKQEVQTLSAQLDSLRAQLPAAQTAVDLHQKLAQLEQEVALKERRGRELDAQLDLISEHLNKIFENSTEKALNFAFDGMLSSRMLQTAAAWESQERDRNDRAALRQLQAVNPQPMKPAQLIDHLCSLTARYRPNYDRNLILNLYLCLTQGFLTVFSGEPGTGKTSICNILAHCLGLTLPRKQTDGQNLNRYLPISVERGWNSKRDLIGYYNPLTKQFDRSNRNIYDSLRILDLEAKGDPTGLPCLMLLDEANLSPMEFYWADFMNICDGIRPDSAINLGEDYTMQIPECLRFVATVNNDHTTEALSPRLIDRAWVIRLPNLLPGAGAVVQNPPLDWEGVQPISWNSLVNAFGGEETNPVVMPNSVREIYDAILSRLEAMGILASARSELAIQRYWSVAQGLFEDDNAYGIDASVVALDYAAAQRLLPHISGSGGQFGDALEALTGLCQKNNLRQCTWILDHILSSGRESLHHYCYFS